MFTSKLESQPLKRHGLRLKNYIFSTEKIMFIIQSITNPYLMNVCRFCDGSNESK